MVVLKHPVKARSLVDELVARLEHAIMTGELEGGTLLREQTLASSLGVSRGPLREAIRQLEGRMLLRRKPNVGASVVALSPTDLQEIWTMREALEGIACGLAAGNITDQEIEELKGTIENQERDLRNDEWAETYEESPEFDFHYKIMLASRNQRLTQMICGDLYYLLKVYYRYRGSSVDPKRAADALKEHRGILKALISRDSAKAEALMRDHIRNALKSFLRAMLTIVDKKGAAGAKLAPAAYRQSSAASEDSKAVKKPGRRKSGSLA